LLRAEAFIIIGKARQAECYSHLTKEMLQIDRKKSREETGYRSFTKSVFVPADVETELYTDLLVHCCLPAGTVCHGKPKTVHRYFIRSYKITSIKRYDNFYWKQMRQNSILLRLISSKH